MKKTIIIVFFILFLVLIFPNDYKSYTSNRKTITKEESSSWIIDIPKIKLYKEISKTNDIDHNIIVIKPSGFPTKKDTLILASHSGSSKYSFFNNLYKLKLKDKAYLRQSNNIYRYNLTNIYKQKKTGTINIYKDDSKTNLILVTCTNNDNKTQTVYVFELI